MKQTEPHIDSKINSKKQTKLWQKRAISEDDQTSDISSHRKIEIENYCEKKIKADFKELYPRFYFSEKDTDFVRLVDYYPYRHSTQIQKELEGINFERVEREHTQHILTALEQARQVINNLQKTYLQRIIDSAQLNNFLLALLNLDEWTNRRNVKRFDFALNLFTIGLKIIIDEYPKPIRKHMEKAMEEFYDMADLPSQLGYKQDKTLTRPDFTKDGMQIKITQPATKPRYKSKNKLTEK